MLKCTNADVQKKYHVTLAVWKKRPVNAPRQPDVFDRLGRKYVSKRYFATLP